VLPAARAGASFHEPMSSGKFQGTIAPTTPTGSGRVQAKAWPTSGETAGVRPASFDHQPPKYCQVSAASAGSV
jgi:hypothetical protein